MNALCCFGVCFVIAVLELSAGGAVGTAVYGSLPSISCNQTIVLTGFGDLRPPENVRIDSLNTRYVLRWDWPHETAANQTVTFTAQYIAEHLSQKYEHWKSVCVSVLEHRCDFTGAKLHYLNLYQLRVRANTSRQSSGWVQIEFCPEKHAAVGPPSSVKLNPVEGDLEIIIRDPLSSNNESMKILLDDKLSYLIQYWRRSEDPQMAKSQKAKDSVVTLTELDRQTWYCVRAQSWYFDTYKKCNKSSVFSDTHCIRTKGRMPYWQIALYILIILLLLFLPPLLYFRFYKMFRSTFWPAIQLPDHIQELWLSDSEKPQLLAPESRESVCEPLVMVRAVLDAEEVDEQSSNAEDQDSSTHGRHGSGDSGVYSAEEDSGRRSTSHADLQMSVTKHRGELHDGTLQQLCA
ncbi:interferon alpha/beta receptor 1b isoform X2 [Labeo rohita]|uniref:interferon alpha/beta receptor 1b isoform X2 n=1 Tax=Labeo rohita TaxID=84645 RepID=UPI0021E1EB8C|nr:interferon alpha/beta receptor 1b isoform X2 [Labeo rohita]